MFRGNYSLIYVTFNCSTQCFVYGYIQYFLTYRDTGAEAERLRQSKWTEMTKLVSFLSIKEWKPTPVVTQNKIKNYENEHYMSPLM